MRECIGCNLLCRGTAGSATLHYTMPLSGVLHAAVLQLVCADLYRMYSCFLCNLQGSPPSATLLAATVQVFFLRHLFCTILH